MLFISYVFSVFLSDFFLCFWVFLFLAGGGVVAYQGFLVLFLLCFSLGIFRCLKLRVFFCATSLAVLLWLFLPFAGIGLCRFWNHFGGLPFFEPYATKLVVGWGCVWPQQHRVQGRPSVYCSTSHEIAAYSRCKEREAMKLCIGQ